MFLSVLFRPLGDDAGGDSLALVVVLIVFGEPCVDVLDEDHTNVRGAGEAFAFGEFCEGVEGLRWEGMMMLPTDVDSGVVMAVVKKLSRAGR